MLADNCDDQLDNLVTPGIGDFQQTSCRIELCAPRARIWEGHTQISIAGRMNDRALFECFTNDIYYHQTISVGTLEEPKYEACYLRHSKIKI